MQERLFRFIIKRKIPVIVLLSVVTVFFGIVAAELQFDNTIESYFLEGDLRNYNRFLDEFGSDEIIVVAFGDDDVFTIPNFRLLDTLSRRLEAMPHVRRVLSLTTAEIVSGEEDFVIFEKLTPNLPRTPQELVKIRARALGDPIIPGTLVSPDGRNTAIVAEIEHLIGEFDYKVDLLRNVRALLAEQERKTGKEFRVAGTAVLDDAVMRYTVRDQVLFLPVMTVIILSVMYTLFRRFVTTLLPLFVVAVSMVWAYGFMSLVGYKVNIISTIIGPLLMSVGIADSIHIVSDYLQESSCCDRSPIENIEHSFLSVLGPCVMTTVTTIAGLLSLLTADLVPIRQFAVAAAVGIFGALIVTVFLLPILLALIPVRRVVDSEFMRAGQFTKLLAWLGTWQRGRAAIVLLACLLAVGPSAYSLSHLRIGTNSLDYFREHDPVRKDTEWIDQKIGGTTSLEFFIEAEHDNALNEPALLEKVERFQSYLRAVPGVTKVFSVTDLVKTLNRGFHGGSEGAFRIPASADAVAQELLIVEGSEDLDALLSMDRTRGRITARVAMGASRALAHQMPEVEDRIHQIFDEEVKVTPTGLVYLMHEMEGYLLSTQIRSFILAFVVVNVVMAGALRSLRLAALAIIPNLLPVAFVLALMPVLNIPLDVGTVMIAGVALGLVVDDSIHFLYRFKEQNRQVSDARQALAEAMNLTGRPIIFTSIVLSFGFVVLVLASFNPVIHFGVLAALVIALALIFDLIVLPALAGYFRWSL